MNVSTTTGETARQSAPDHGDESAGGRVLLIEDDAAVAAVAASYLRASGLTVRHVEHGDAAMEAIREAVPDLVVLDRMLPGKDGIQICRELRQYISAPIMMLTALGSEDDRIAGLEAGADDYITKPFSPRELVLRAHAVLRRTSDRFNQEVILAGGPFTVDRSARTATMNGAPLALTGREFDLFAFLLGHPGTAFRRDELLAEVWGWTVGDLSTVTVHVRRLREKVETDVTDPRYVQTVWGIGYRFEAERHEI